MAEYEKLCECCDQLFYSKKQHTRTCGNNCRSKIWRQGWGKKECNLIGKFNNQIELIANFKNSSNNTIYMRKVNSGVYAYNCTTNLFEGKTMDIWYKGNKNYFVKVI